MTAEEVQAIKAAARRAFGADAVVRLFGSRVDDARHGGDIDLHVELPATVNFSSAKEGFLDRLFARIDPQRVDVIATVKGATPRPIEAIAYRDGIVL
nr:hypothetical protein [Sphingomonas liriopis]